MKNLVIAFVMAIFIVGFAGIMSNQRSAPDTIYLDPEQKLVTIQYHDRQLIVTTRKRQPTESPESYTIRMYPSNRTWIVVEQ